MTKHSDLDAFQKIISYRFNDVLLLREALTHSSARKARRSDNQRLEFLGDRVLGVAIAEALLDADTQATEGILAPRLNALVRKEKLAEIAEEMGLGDFVLLGRSERYSKGRSKFALLADALEAVIAAIYLDGGYLAAAKFINALWREHIRAVAVDARDAKTILQEFAQAKGGFVPEYALIALEGPAHLPSFTMKVCLQTGESGVGKAGSKREAEQLAAQDLLGRIGKND